jgi:hypothetical protein
MSYMHTYPIPSETSAFSTSPVAAYAREASDGQEIADLPLHSTLQSIGRLLSLSSDWDGHGSAAPRRESVSSSLAVVRLFRNIVVSAGQRWAQPHVSTNEDGNVVFEWWQSTRKLTVYVRSAHVTYIKVWGVNIDSEMEDGCVTDKGFASLWMWLNEA